MPVTSSCNESNYAMSDYMHTKETMEERTDIKTN